MKALLIENEPVARLLLEKQLRSFGFDVITRTDGKTALAEFQQRFSPLIIVDLGLPEMYGLDLCRQIRTIPRSQQSIILALTERHDMAYLRSILEAGVDEYLMKPFSMELFKMRLYLIEYRLQQGNVPQELITHLTHLNTAAEQARVGVTVTDPAGKIVYTNPAEARMHGQQVDELVGQDVGILAPPDMRHPLPLEEIQADPRQTRQSVNRHKNGTTFPVKLTSEILTNGGNNPVGLLTISENLNGDHQAEQQLRFQAQLLQNVRESLVATDLEGRVTYWGKGAEALYGYPADEVMGAVIPLSVGPFDEIENDERIRQVLENGTWSGRYVQQRKDGTLFLADTMMSLMTDSEGELIGFISIDRDVTSRKQIEETLRYSEERYRTLVEAASDGIFLFNANGDILSINQEAAHNLGHSPKELVGRNLRAVLPTEVVDANLKTAQTVFRTGHKQALPDSLITTAKGPRWFSTVLTPVKDSTGHVIYVIGIARDVTDRKHAEAQVQFHAQLLDSVRESVVATDMAEHVIYWGKGAEDLYGWTVEEMRGQPFTVSVASHPENHASRIQQVHKIGAWRGECIQRRRDGSLFWADTAISLVKDPVGHPCGMVRIDRDVTEHKNAENALRASEMQYRVLADNVADGLVIVQKGEVVFVNKAFTYLSGYTEADIIRTGLATLFPPKFQGLFTDWLGQISQIMSDRPFRGACVTPDEQEIWTEWYATVIAWEGKPAILLTVRNVTDSRQRELTMEQEKAHLQRENIALKSTMQERYKFGNLVGKSPAMQQVYQFISEAATSDANVVIYGESGTGKELVAHTIHSLSDRKDQEFVAVNCGAIPESLFESEFFGYRKGAFTGAATHKQGLFDRAHGGTLFLDEIGELTPAMQVKLLRVLQGGEYIPVGDNKGKRADVRIIAATNRELREQVHKNMMREDFFYRIHVIAVNLPPLRSRREDIPLVVEHFLTANGWGRSRRRIPAKVMEALYNYDWPGNIRELQNELQRYLATNQLELRSSSNLDLLDNGDWDASGSDAEGLELRQLLDEVEKQVIVRRLDRNHWHRGKTAKALGLPLRTLHRKMKKHQLI